MQKKVYQVWAHGSLTLDFHAKMVFQTDIAVSLTDSSAGKMEVSNAGDAEKLVAWLKQNGYPNARIQ